MELVSLKRVKKTYSLTSDFQQSLISPLSTFLFCNNYFTPETSLYVSILTFLSVVCKLTFTRPDRDIKHPESRSIFIPRGTSF